MRVLEFLFAIVARFNQYVTEGNLREIRNDAEKWHEDTVEASKNPVAKLYIKYSEMWYTRLILACIFPFLTKGLVDYLHDNQIEEEDLENERIR